MRSNFEHAVLAVKHRQRLWRARVAALIGSAALIIAACWAAGVFDRWRLWFAPEAEIPALAQPTPVMPTPPPMAQKTLPRLADAGALGRMRLIATRPGRNTREGTAQIAIGNADALTYIAGALLANGAAIVEVHADHVRLKRDQMTTELYVDGIVHAARGAKAVKVREALITVEKPPVQQASKTLGPQTYSNILRAAPRFVDRDIAGFEVYPGTEAAALGRLNLQSGDVLLEIDGRVLQSVEQLHGSLKSISSGASVTATVQRGTQQVVLTMDGAMLKPEPRLAPDGLPDLPAANGVGL